jgi:hypothetical protein
VLVLLIVSNENFPHLRTFKQCPPSFLLVEAPIRTGAVFAFFEAGELKDVKGTSPQLVDTTSRRAKGFCMGARSLLLIAITT